MLASHHNHCVIDVDLGSANSNTTNYNYYKDKKVRNPYSCSSTDPFNDVLKIFSERLKNQSSWMLIGMTFFVLITAYYWRQFHWIMTELQMDTFDQLVKSYQNMQMQSMSKQKTLDLLQRLEKENTKLQREKREMKFYYETDKINAEREIKSEQNRLTSIEQAWTSQVEMLQKKTSRESRRAVIDKFGEGPHHIEFTFILPSDTNETERTFTVETAPLDFMPHAVHLFLEQVAHNLWDNTWFYMNGPHVLQAGPMLDEETYESMTEEEWESLDEHATVLKPFKDKDLDSLAFPEYSEKFPHVEWTLGFADRPGGPDWYINKVDNTKSHGPGGKHKYAIEEQGDPCFAKVISGFDQLELIFNEPTVEEGQEWEYYFMEPPYIMEARIVDRPKPFLALNHLTNSTEHEVEGMGHAQLHHRMHKIHIDHQVEA